MFPVCVIEGFCALAGLYLGGLQSLPEAEQIGITHFVVSCVRIRQTKDIKPSPRFPDHL